MFLSIVDYSEKLFVPVRQIVCSYELGLDTSVLFDPLQIFVQAFYVVLQGSEFALRGDCTGFRVTVSHEYSTIVPRQDLLVVCWVLAHQVERSMLESAFTALLDDSVSQVSYRTCDSVDDFRLLLHHPVSVTVIDGPIVLRNDVPEIVVISPFRIP